MSDDRALREYIERLEIEARPSEPFAAGLHETLTRRRLARQGPRRTMRMLAGPLAAAAVLVGIGVALATATLQDDVARSPTPTPGPVSPPMSASAEPTPTTSAPRSASPSPVAVDVAARGDVLRVAVDDLRVRRAPGTAGEAFASFSDGEDVVVQSGPSAADGHEWYEVAGGGVLGWVAASGPEGEVWLAEPPADDAPHALLEVRVQGHITSDVYMPDAVLLTDGRLIWMEHQETGSGEPGRTSIRERQLNGEGLAYLTRLAFESGYLAEAGTFRAKRIPGTEPPGRGISSYHFTTTRAGSSIEVASWTPDWEPEFWTVPEAMHELDAVAQVLLSPTEAIEPQYWAAEGLPHTPAAFLVLATWHAEPWDQPSVDVHQVAWPVEGDIEDFGEPFGDSGETAYSTRCGVFDSNTAEAALAALTAAGVDVDTHLDQPRIGVITLGWAREAGEVRMTLLAVLPGRAQACDNGILRTESSTPSPTPARAAGAWQDRAAVPPIPASGPDEGVHEPAQLIADAELGPDGRIYVIFHGLGDNALAAYDPAENTWTMLQTGGQTPHVSGSAQLVLGHDDLMYLFMTGATDTEVYVYDPAAEAWKPGPSYQLEEQFVADAIAAPDGLLYFTHAPYGGPTQMRAFDPADGSVTPLASVSGSFGAAIERGSDGRLYAVAESGLASYDPASDTWRIESAEVVGEYRHPPHFAGSGGDLLYLVTTGAMDDEADGPVGVAAWDLGSESWLTLPPMDPPMDSALLVVDPDERLYAIESKIGQDIPRRVMAFIPD